MIEMQFERVNVAIRQRANCVDSECNADPVGLIVFHLGPIVYPEAERGAVSKRDEIPASPLRKADLNTYEIFDRFVEC